MGLVKIIVFLALFYVSTATRTISKSSSLTHASSDFNYVCNAEKFASYGLEMSTYAFCNKSLPYNVRVRDLVDSMIVEEKVQQLGNKANGVPRLGLPPYQWWSEALHGVSNVGPGTFFNETIPGATSFPTVILSAASFNESLWKSLGQAVSTEARAMYNLGMAGLTFWSPNINVVRDPRWGRALETPGEDPFVVGRYAVNYVRGLQDVEGHENASDLNSRPLKVSACCKHYAAYDVDNWLGVDRFHFDARILILDKPEENPHIWEKVIYPGSNPEELISVTSYHLEDQSLMWPLKTARHKHKKENKNKNKATSGVTEQDMVETFLRPFEMCVKEGDVSSVMCSYNRVNGIPTCADPKLLSDTVRGDWNLHGYVVSDCDSIEVLVDGHKWLGDSKEDAVAHVLKAGLDLDCGDYYPNFTMAAVNMGKVRESDIDKALFYLYNVLMRLGFFDGIPAYATLGKDDVCTKENIELAIDAARQGIVLLKNDNNTLPLKSKKDMTIAVVGPHANATSAMIGNYAGIPCKVVSPLDAFSKEAKVKYAMGCGDVQCPNDTFIFKAMEAAKHADATIIFAGLDLSVEAESLDRTDLLLPGYQTQLINQIANIATNPVILVIMSAGGVDISFAKDNPKINAIIWAGYPGEQGGAAIADVIFGRYNPGGKLPLTWYTADYVGKLPMTSLQLRPDDEMGYPGRTYKFYNGSTVYSFGYGLSYTQFNMTLVRGPRSVKVKLSSNQHCHSLPTKPNGYMNPCPSVLVDELSNTETIVFEVLVENVGGRDGSLVLIVYAEPPQQFEGFPFKQAVEFKRVALKAGKSKTVKFELDVAKSLSVVTDTAYVALPSGGHMIHVHGDGAVTFPVNVEFHY